MKIKAIETIYQGYRMRSRLEARYGVFFNSLGLKWEYEKEGMVLPSGPYLPDFWLPELDCWIEIKGEEPTPKERRLAEELSEAHKTCVLLHGIPMENPGAAYLFDCTDAGAGDGWWDEMRWGITPADEVCLTTGDQRSSRTYAHTSHCNGNVQGGTTNPRIVQAFACEVTHPRLYLARLDAIGARFEHGERPRV